MAEKSKLLLRDQSGAALVIALVMIVVLTLIALASTLSSNFENKLSGNKRGSTDCFYTADSGIQAALANISNFDTNTYALVPNTGSLPGDLQNQSIDSKLTSPSLGIPALPASYTAPTVYVYHTTSTGSPRGLHLSAVGNYGFAYFIIDSKGCDQLDVSLVSFKCEQQEQVVRLLPTSQGGI
jgi:hypothetical protein